jgi:hypothetical protein
MVLFANYRRYRFWIAAYLAYQVYTTLHSMYSVSGLVTVILAAVLLYHRFVRPLRLSILVVIGVLGVYGCMAYAVARGQRHAERMDVGVNRVLSSSSEFDAMFGTSFDLLRRRQAGVLPPIPWPTYFNDIVNVVPQQFLPFEKSYFPQWYLVSFYPELYKVGGGVNFGVIPETIIGFGRFQLIVFGLVLGVGFGWLHRWVAGRPNSFWAMAFYLWLCLQSYLCYRISNFITLNLFVYTFLPTYLVCRVLCREKPKPQKIARREFHENATALLHC